MCEREKERDFTKKIIDMCTLARHQHPVEGVCVCVCVYGRERESREREIHQIDLCTYAHTLTLLSVISTLWRERERVCLWEKESARMRESERK